MRNTLPDAGEKLSGKRARILIIGVGNPFGGDDAVGIDVAKELKRLQLPQADVIFASGEGSSLLDSWEEYPVVLLLDAVSSGAAAGTIHRFDAGREPLPAKSFHHSTHAVTVADAIEIARTLKRLPERIVFFGVEGKRFAAGEAMSPAVRRAGRRLVKTILAECKGLSGR